MKVSNTLFRLLLGLLILLFVFVIHEYGHFTEFQKRGVPVQEFSIGIGPALYQYQYDAVLTISLRAIPIMAYVAPTKEGGDLFFKEATTSDKITVSSAGVRNNFLAGWLAVFLLQCVGWRRGNISTVQLVREVVVTPLKIVFRTIAFFVGCLTLGRINLTKRTLLSTGGVAPSKHMKWFIFLNIMFVFFNLAPVPPLDGIRVFTPIFDTLGIHAHFSGMWGSVVLFVFIIISNVQYMRILEVDAEENPT